MTQLNIAYYSKQIEDITKQLDAQNHTIFGMVKAKVESIMDDINGRAPDYNVIYDKLADMQRIMDNMPQQHGGSNELVSELKKSTEILKTQVQQKKDSMIDDSELMDNDQTKQMFPNLNLNPLQQQIQQSLQQTQLNAQVSFLPQQSFFQQSNMAQSAPTRQNYIGQPMQGASAFNTNATQPELYEFKKLLSQARKQLEKSIHMKNDEVQQRFNEQVADLTTKMGRFENQLNALNQDYSSEMNSIFITFGNKIKEFESQFKQNTQFLQQCQEKQDQIVEAQGQISAMVDQMCALQKKADEYYRLMDDLKRVQNYDTKLNNMLLQLEAKVGIGGATGQSGLRQPSQYF